MEKFSNFLIQIGTSLSRPESVTKFTSHPTQILLGICVFLALASITAITYVRPVTELTLGIAKFFPEIPIPRSRWKIHFPTAMPCTSSSCVINVPQDEIQASSINLADSDAFEKTALPENKVFWVGVKLTKEEMKKSRELSAFTFILGHINASFQVFVNGKLKSAGDGRDYIPATVEISNDSSVSSGEVAVAILVNQDLGSARPFVVWAPKPSGLSTYRTVQMHRDSWVVTSVVFPIACSILPFIAFIAFFLIWLSDRERIELLLFAAFSLCLSLNELNGLGSIKFWTERVSSYRYDCFIRIMAATLAAMIGFTFSRLKETLNWGILIIAVFICALVARTDSPSEVIRFESWLGYFYQPLCFLLSSAAAANQALVIASNYPKFGSRGKWRARQLGIFAVLNMLIFGYTLFVSPSILSIDLFSPFHRTAQSLVVFVLGLFLILNHRNRLAHLKAETIRGEFAAQVAHDVRAPLAVIEAAIAHPAGRELSPLLISSLKRIRAIADGLLDVELRPRDSGPVTRLAGSVLQDALSAILLEKKALHPICDFEVVANVDASRLEIIAEKDALSRCISNILENSIDSMVKDSIKIKIEMAEDSKAFVLSVSDNGRGIPEAIVGKVGVRGFSYGKSGRGLGLGLSYARECLAGWGGSLEISKNDFGGTTITMRFKKALWLDRGDDTQIVLVENDQSIIDLWKIAAKKSKKEFRCYSSFKELEAALESLNRDAYFYIDLELGPNSPDGLTVAKNLYSRGYVNIYLATGRSPKEVADQGWIKGIVGKSPPWL